MLIKNLCLTVTNLKFREQTVWDYKRAKRERLWRTALFVSFTVGVLTETLFDFKVDVFFLLEDQAAILALLVVPSLFSLMAATTVFGGELLLPVGFLYGAALAFCSRILWMGELWGQRQIRFVLCASLCVPSFFLLSMLANRSSIILRNAIRREGASLKAEILDTVYVGSGIMVCLLCSIWILCKTVLP